MQESSNKEFVLKFSMGTIDHLGIQMYQTLPPVIAELISNSYDADSENVNIHFDEKPTGEKTILIKDDGNGMSFEEINNKFLVIGRNRRLSEDGGNISTIKKRKVTGRKGIGKLAIFGIAEEIYIKTIKNGIKNELRLSLTAIKNCESKSEELSRYSPQAITINANSDGEPDGTLIELNKIKRKSQFKIDEIITSISKRFTFNDDDFLVKFHYNNEEKGRIDKETKWKIFKGQFTWDFPVDKDEEYSYIHADKIYGKIITSNKPLDEASKGITLYARGKLVNRNEFYGIKITTSNAYNYMTGFLNVDFIDDFDDDLINTSRDGLVWDNDSLEGLKNWIQQQLKNIEKKWRDKRIAERINDYKDKNQGKDYTQWIDKLPSKHEQKLANDIVKTIILNEKIPEDVTSTLLQYVQSSFQYSTFKDFAVEIDSLNLESPELTTKLLELFKDWQAIESKEFYKLCIGRVQAIKKLEKLIDENAKEVPEIHTFLKKYPWLMEPRIKDFNDEITFTKLLRDEFKDDNITPESDKRIDFYCKSFDNNIYIYELKRPNITAKIKELQQLTAYKEFVQLHCGNERRSYQNIYCYLLCKGISSASAGAQTTANALMGENIYVRTYSEILGQAYNYHKEFIDKYDKMNLE